MSYILNDLPLEILEKIFYHVDIRSIKSFRSLNKQTINMFKDNKFWIAKHINDYGFKPYIKNIEESYNKIENVYYKNTSDEMILITDQNDIPIKSRNFIYLNNGLEKIIFIIDEYYNLFAYIISRMVVSGFMEGEYIDIEELIDLKFKAINIIYNNGLYLTNIQGKDIYIEHKYRKKLIYIISNIDKFKLKYVE